MKTYKYELIVYFESQKIKRFIGNDLNELQERFELWFIKQVYDRNDIFIQCGEIQHAG